jgi:hypothetical protein
LQAFVVGKKGGEARGSRKMARIVRVLVTDLATIMPVAAISAGDAERNPIKMKKWRCGKIAVLKEWPGGFQCLCLMSHTIIMLVAHK